MFTRISSPPESVHPSPLAGLFSRIGVFLVIAPILGLRVPGIAADHFALFKQSFVTERFDPEFRAGPSDLIDCVGVLDTTQSESE